MNCLKLLPPACEPNEPHFDFPRCGLVEQKRAPADSQALRACVPSEPRPALSSCASAAPLFFLLLLGTGTQALHLRLLVARRLETIQCCLIIVWRTAPRAPHQDALSTLSQALFPIPSVHNNISRLPYRAPLTLAMYDNSQGGEKATLIDCFSCTYGPQDPHEAAGPRSAFPCLRRNYLHM